MIKLNLKYTDYDGNVREEEYRFNLSKAELIELEYTMEGGLKQHIENIIKAKDVTQIYKMFAFVVDKSYGKKSPDGKRFMKSPEILAEFKESEAYSELLMKFIQEPKFAANFVNDILPADINKYVQQENNNASTKEFLSNK